MPKHYFDMLRRMLDADAAAHNDNVIVLETEMFRQWAAGEAA